MLADDLRDGARVHAAQARHALLLQERVHIVLAAEVGRRVAPLAHHIAAHMAIALKFLLDDAVIADHREGLHNDLAVIAGIGQRLDVAAHARGEHHLTDHVALRAERLPLEHRSVRQNKIPFLHARCLRHCVLPAQFE